MHVCVNFSGFFRLLISKTCAAGECSMIVGPHSMKLPQSWDTGSVQPSAPASEWRPARLSPEPASRFCCLNFISAQLAQSETAVFEFHDMFKKEEMEGKRRKALLSGLFGSNAGDRERSTVVKRG